MGIWLLLTVVSLSMGLSPRKTGCTDLTEVERGVVTALEKVKLTVKGEEVTLGPAKIASAIGRSRSAVKKLISKKNHVKKRGAPKAKYTEADVQRAVNENAELRKRFHNKRQVTYKMVMHQSGWKFSESALRREFQKRKLAARPLRYKLQLSPNDEKEREEWALAQMVRPVEFWESQVCYVDCKCFKEIFKKNQ